VAANFHLFPKLAQGGANAGSRMASRPLDCRKMPEARDSSPVRLVLPSPDDSGSLHQILKIGDQVAVEQVQALISSRSLSKAELGRAHKPLRGGVAPDRPSNTSSGHDLWRTFVAARFHVFHADTAFSGRQKLNRLSISNVPARNRLWRAGTQDKA